MDSKLSVHHVVLAALMHDIGKVIQRTGVSEKWESKKHLDKCLFPHGNDSPTYKHVMYTAAFLEKYPLPIDEWETVVELAGCHHNERVFQHTAYSDHLNYLIIADRISSSWDREKGEENRNKPGIFKKVPLYSIFDRLQLDKSENRTIKHFYSLKKKSPQSLLELKKDSELKDRSDEYTELWTDFLAEFEVAHSYFYDVCLKNKKVFINDYFPQYISIVDALLSKYFWCVPANTNEPFPTNSLYHHLRNSASIAAVCYQAHQDKDLSINTSENNFLMISGDLNGIQKYLFDLNPENSSKTSKLLRSRSFQIKLIMDMISIKIIEELNLTAMNVFMNAGGKWIILAPNHTSVKNALNRIKSEVENEMYKIFLGCLNLNLNWNTIVSLSKLDKYNFLNSLGDCIDNTEKEKVNKFSTVLKAEDKWNSDEFVINREAVYYNEVCSFCNRRKADPELMFEDETACPFCFREIKLGEILVKENIYYISSENKCSDHGRLKVAGMIFSEVPSGKHIHLKPGYNYFKIKEDDNFPQIPLKQIAAAVPKDASGNLVTFDKIAQKAVTYKHKDNDKNNATITQGIAANAAVKGDVDNLGLLFQYGLLKKDNNNNLYCSITDYTTLSSLMDYFFGVIVPNEIESSYQDSIYTVYAGGDDFCLVGAYNKIIEFTKKLRDDFSMFTCYNPDVHLSAAIKLMHPKEPIKNVILKADKDLDSAKNEVIAKKKKDKLSLFETIIPWEKTDEIFQLSEDFNKWLDETDISLQFFYRLLAYQEMYLETKKPQTDVRNFMYHSLYNYDIKRNVDKIKNKIVNHKNIADELRQLNAISGESNMDYLRIAICKTIYEKRTQ